MTAVERPAPATVPSAAPGAVADGRRDRHRAARWVIRGVLWSGLVFSFAATCYVVGLPTDRVVLLGWVLAGLGVHAITEGWRRVVRLLVDWVPLAGLLLLYDASRGVADTLGLAVHVTEPVAADRWLGGGGLPTVWLQAHWRADWWLAVATLVYISHFVATPVVLGILWVRNRPLWARCARFVIALSAAGLLTYVLYPAAPPWLAAKEHVIEPVKRLSSAGWKVLGLPHAGTLLAHGQGQVNQVAAVPSLHTAFAVLICLMLFPVARHLWQRVALVGYAVLMPLVLVWSGEHYVIDTLLGAVYAVVIVVLLRIGERLVRRARRGSHPAADPLVAASGGG
jgi:hypothetical protein